MEANVCYPRFSNETEGPLLQSSTDCNGSSAVGRADLKLHPTSLSAGTAPNRYKDRTTNLPKISKQGHLATSAVLRPPTLSTGSAKDAYTVTAPFINVVWRYRGQLRFLKETSVLSLKTDSVPC